MEISFNDSNANISGLLFDKLVLEIQQKLLHRVAGHSMGRTRMHPREKILSAKVRYTPHRARQAHSQLSAWTSRHNRGMWGVVSQTIYRCQILHLQILASGWLQDLLQMPGEIATMCIPKAEPHHHLVVASNGYPFSCKKPWKRSSVGMTPLWRGGLMSTITIFTILKLAEAPFTMP